MFSNNYGTKWVFNWLSTNGAECTISLQKANYNGSYTTRRLGRAPVLKQKNNGNIYGTSLEFYAECQVEGEFAELYTSSPFEYRVSLVRRNGANIVDLWTGFVSPELYSAPDIAPPYDVDIIATDGLGELKEHTFDGYGPISLDMLFKYLLAETHNGLPQQGGDVPPTVNYVSRLRALSPVIAMGSFYSMTHINLDYKKGETLYDVLQYLLDTIHAGITFFRGYWLIFRETDYTFNTSGNAYLNGTNSTVPLTKKTVGRLGVAPLWPVGNTVTKIEPAKNSITVEAPAEYYTPIVNPEIEEDSGWTKSGSRGGEPTAYDAIEQAYKILGSGSMGSILQNVNIDLSIPTSFNIKSCAAHQISGDSYSIMVDLFFIPDGYTWADGFTLRDRGGELSWNTHSEWTLDDINKYGVFGAYSAVPSGLIGAPIESGGTIPPFSRAGYPSTGTLRIQIESYSAFVYSFFLTREFGKGFRDTIKINNGARGSGDTVEIAIGRETTELNLYKDFMRGIMLDGDGNLVTRLADARFTTGLNYLSLISRGYALSVALPRLKLSGTLNTPANLGVFPLILEKDTINYRFLSYSWDLLNDEIEIEAISLPAATLEVTSETVVSLNGASSAGGSSSSGGSSGGGGGVPQGLTLQDVQDYLDAEGYITGITSANVTAALGYTPVSSNQMYHAIDDATANLPTTAQMNQAIAAAVADIEKSLQGAPILRKVYGFTPRSNPKRWGSVIDVSHPALSQQGYEAVLMVYAKRNSRAVTDQYGAKKWQKKKGWAVAVGNNQLTGSAPLTTTSSFNTSDLQVFILKRYIEIQGLTAQQIYNSVDYHDFNHTYRTAPKGFRGSHKGYKRFGIAIRCENPAFVEATTAAGYTPKATTGSIFDTRTHTVIPRYLYSAVAPLDVQLRSGQGSGVIRNIIVFGLAGG